MKAWSLVAAAAGLLVACQPAWPDTGAGVNARAPKLTAAGVNARTASQAAVPNQAAVPSQANRSIKGRVTEGGTGNPLAHCIVTLHQVGDPRLTEVETDENGLFIFSKLKPGDYVLSVSAEGLLAQTRTVSARQVSPSLEEFALESLEGTDVLHVTGQRLLINPEKFGSSTNIDKTYLDQIGNGNNLRQVIETTPGIMADSLGSVITRGEHNAVNYTLDGAVIPETAGVLQQGQLASPRSLQSMTVDTGGYEASDGGGPMGAVVRMRSMHISAKPVVNIGGQLGGPISGGMPYYLSAALSQDPNSIWNRLRVESSGSLFASKLGMQPGTRAFRRDARININSMTKVVFEPTVRDRISLIGAINESYMHQPTSPISRAAGVKINEHDRQNFIMLSYRHQFARFFDEANLHLINSFYSQRISQPNVFDPNPVINGNGLLRSAAVNAKRFDYVFSAQGDISKTLLKTHSVKAGFLTDLRFARTQLSEWVYDANRTDSGYGQLISPFTGLPGGPQFQGNMGKYHGSQWVQSAYLQDTWKPQANDLLKRLTVNYGARFDIADSLFGNAIGIAETVAAIPGAAAFNSDPFKRQRQINAQVSGRYGGTFVVNKKTLLRGSFSNVFVPNPVDYFLTPFSIANGPWPFNGIYDGSPRPLQAMRGRLVDAGIENQVNNRFVIRNSVFYKKLYHFGDSGVVDNSLVYNRLTNNEQESYGYETRIELKPSRNGTGVYGYLSNTLAVAYLRGSRKNDGGFWVNEPAPLWKYPDHDRREAISAALGYRSKRNFWVLTTLSAYSGVKDQRFFQMYGPHPARVPFAYFIGLNAGYTLPPKLKRDHRLLPDSIELRVQNLTNNRAAINLGSPFQGTRYALPISVLACMNWSL